MNGKDGQGHPLLFLYLALILLTAKVFNFHNTFRVLSLFNIVFPGGHTVYIWNDHKVQTLTCDVYRGQILRTSLDIKAGIVGIVMPLRAVVQAQFLFSLQLVPNNILVYNPQQTPNLLELETKRGFGLLVSNVFLLPIHNVFNTAITVTFSVDSPMDETENFHLREAKRHHVDHNNLMPTSIAPGQTLAMPVELVRTVGKGTTKNTGQTAGTLAADEPTFMQCTDNRKRVFTIIVSPSRGSSVQVELELECRRWDQSFHFSYLSHDDSVAQAAVVLPLDYHSPVAAHRSSPSSSSSSSRRKNRHINTGRTGNVDVNSEESVNYDAINEVYRGFPVLLSYHGSGISPLSHADAHKMMPSNAKNYIFGVQGFYLLAPSRFGAHNWEGVGELTGRAALQALVAATRSSALSGLLPMASSYHGIMSGHSMGGHGAWVTALNMPSNFLCAAPTAGWIHKTAYGNSNDFLTLDVATTFTPLKLQQILAQGLTEYHVDELVANLRHHNVHIRVGSHDMTTHAWYSRRMYRLLRHEQQQVQAAYQITAPTGNVTLEEVVGKQHWWWDSLQENDGGVLNDKVLRGFYSRCRQRGQKAIQYLSSLASPKTTTLTPDSQADIISESDRTPDDQEANSPTEATETVITSSASTLSSTPASMGSRLKQQTDSLNGGSSDSVGASRGSTEARGNQRASSESSSSPLMCDQHGLRLAVINPATHTGLCGVQIVHQERMLELSTADINCQWLSEVAYRGLVLLQNGRASTISVTSSHIYEGTETESQNTRKQNLKVCTLRVSNVQRLQILIGQESTKENNSLLAGLSSFYDAAGLIIVDDSAVETSETMEENPSSSTIFDLQALRQSHGSGHDGFVHVCISSDDNRVHVCPSQELYPLREKTLTTYGPIRRVYDRPFYIVYGTPPLQGLRNAMRDLAVYLANAHYVAHRTLVQVVSDVDFQASNLARRHQLPNLIFVGDIHTNKALKAILVSSSASEHLTAPDGVRGRLPGNITFAMQAGSTSTTVPTAAISGSFGDDDEYADSFQAPSKSAFVGHNVKGGSSSSIQEEYTFRLGQRLFSRSNQAVAFTFPIQRGHDRQHPPHPSHRESGRDLSELDVALGMCLHGNSVAAYRHLTRLAWSVIPPMVRAPFALYLPDFVVLDERIWSRGPGGIVAAGYWDNHWQFDVRQAYWPWK